MQKDPALKDSIRLHQPLKDTIGKALAAVYNAQTPTTDSLFNFYQVKTFLKPSLRRIKVYLDSNTVNISNIQQGDKAIGVPSVDSLMNKYNFQVTSTYVIQDFPAIHMKSNNPLNLTALVQKMGTLNDVKSASIQEIGGDGNDIIYQKKPGYKVLNFMIRWGDCPAGCIYERQYQFKIDQDCDLTSQYSGNSINRRHPLIDTGTSAVFGPDRNDSFAYIFPNPVKNEFTLRVFKPVGRIQVTIFKSNGTVVSQQSKTFPQIPSNAEFDLSGSTNGVYFMTLIGARKQQLIKVIKTRNR